MRFRPKALLLLSAALLIPGAGGCSERLLRENVFANTETGIGIFVAQNRQTQMYEGKLGYFRHELFLVPTNTSVNGDKNGPVSVSGPMDQTPEVLADIAGSAGILTGDRATIRQRLAVGQRAVNAPAAIALMADDAEEARAIAQGVLGAGLPDGEVRQAYDLIANVYLNLEAIEDEDQTAAGHVDQLDLVAKRLLTDERRDFKAYDYNAALTPPELTLRPALAAPGNDAGYERFTTATLRLRQLRDSQAELKLALVELGKGTAVNFVDRPAGGGAPPTGVAITTAKAAQLSADYIVLRDLFEPFDRELRSDPAVVAAVDYYMSLLKQGGE
ncbi:MAG: hypothetical protein AAGH88_03405 [Planctomycetota bacterium]